MEEGRRVNQGEEGGGEGGETENGGHESGVKEM